jgi:hypothetical protein
MFARMYKASMDVNANINYDGRSQKYFQEKQIDLENGYKFITAW